MPKTTCHVCGSKEIVPRLKIKDHGHSLEDAINLEMVVKEEGEGFFDLEVTMEAPIKAWLCGDCGHIELYIEDPKAFLEPWKKKIKDPNWPYE